MIGVDEGHVPGVNRSGHLGLVTSSRICSQYASLSPSFTASELVLMSLVMGPPTITSSCL